MTSKDTLTSKGTLIRGTLLIAGTSIGGGMLALPVLTGQVGFFPSMVVYLACWLFMTITGLLFLEIALWMDPDANIVSMAEKTLGGWGKAVAWGLYIFLFYCLTLAYIVGMGDLFVALLKGVLPLKEWQGELLFLLIFGPLIITGHSLGGSNAQLALLNLQQKQLWPERSITVKIFDSPAILDRDVRKFAEWIKINDIKTQLDFHYYISDGDPVPLAGSVEKNSYLGNYLDQPNCTSSVQKLKLTKTGLTKPALIGLHVHDRIFHRGIEGVDFTSTKMSIFQYDAKVFKERISVNISRIFTGAVIWATLAPIGAAKRFFLGRRHHDPIIVQLFKSLQSRRFL